MTSKNTPKGHGRIGYPMCGLKELIEDHLVYYEWNTNVLLAIMKDLSLPLSQYGLKSGSKVLMLADQSIIKKSPEELELEKLQKIVHHVQTELAPMVQDYLHEKEKQESLEKQIKKLQLKVSELLLQSLLKIDGIASVSEEMRSKRKEAVHYIQSLLNKLDN